MGYSTTMVLNLTFLATLGAGFVFFLWHLLIFTIILVLADAGRLAALTLIALSGRYRTKHREGSHGRVIPNSRQSSGSRGRR
ncbi:hypothetical protein [Arthrobacter sp. ISL-5]|uniref:hypothetical protein n=1 Tax=Arthrobacter sp. ISL-5 TaxID=2819111 RepID=UPI001BE96FE6|nr:hypothetical protein [Arthrobacter sp. ISL-5]MBT2551567.1 hypothetical protein [Arthrobacter sp. ISL-5]